MYTAVIVEPRSHPALPFVLRTVLDNLSEEWKILIFHGTANESYVHECMAERPYRFLPPIRLEVENLTRKQYNAMLMSSSFYRCIPTEMHLIFQTDTMILSEHAHLLNLFLEYDYVGAPWKNGWVGNGGLSLRRTNKMREVCERLSPSDAISHILSRVRPLFHTENHALWHELQTHLQETEVNEDVYFCYQRAVPLKIPPPSIAKYFSVETVFCETSFGVHAPWKQLDPAMLIRWQPSIKQLMELQMEDTNA